MIVPPPDVTTTLFRLPPDAKFLQVAELSPRLRARIGAVPAGQSVITRPGFRVTTRLVPGPLAELLAEFHTPSLLTDAVLRFARAHEQDPFATLDLAFDALATLVEARILVPDGSPDALAPAPGLAAGQDFAGFEIDSLVRSLEDSEVYRAHTPEGDPAALKVARDGRPGVTAMLANEARVLEHLAAIDTPRLLADGSANERPYIAMEWCDGVSIAVAAQQARAARDRGRLHRLVGRMFDAYARLHDRGVLHGDVHPGNCLVRDDERVVLLDFGNARSLDSAAGIDLARAGIPQFHDPQMAAALLAGGFPPAATAASEQYAICVLAYLLLTGAQPIDAPAVKDELLRRIVERPPLPFAARQVKGWPEVEAVLARGLAKDPARRFASVADLSRAFLDAGASSIATEDVPRAAIEAFETAVESVRALEHHPDPLRHAWFALRAALALEDAELLGAAEVLVRRAGPDWAAQAVAALVARAACDARMEGRALAGLLDSARTVAGSCESARAVATAAAVLRGTVTRAPEPAAVAEWATRRIDELISLKLPAASAAGALLTYASLVLAQAETIAPPPDLGARLDALIETHKDDVWLWAAAHEVLAEDRFRRLAVAATLPAEPTERAFTLLRLYQLTGADQMLADAHAVLARLSEPAAGVPLLVAELRAPECFLLPPFQIPLSIPA